MELAQEWLVWAKNRVLGAIYASSRRVYCLNSYIIYSKLSGKDEQLENALMTYTYVYEHFHLHKL